MSKSESLSLAGKRWWATLSSEQRSEEVKRRRGERKRKTLEDRLIKKIEKTDTCWTFTGAVNNHGYGVIRDPDSWRNNKIELTHRAAYKIWVGSIPEGLNVLHTCDNPRCVNPKHLRLGTHQDNMQDMAAKGRSGGGKLKAHNVLEIRRRYSLGETQVALAKEFGVKQTTISYIVRGKTWRI